MDYSATTCSRCRAEIVVMTAGEYLSSTDPDVDFALHAHDHAALVAISSEDGAFHCPTCGAHHRLPPRRNDADTSPPAKRADGPQEDHLDEGHQRRTSAPKS